METFNLVLALFAGTVLVINAFSRLLQKVSLPGPLLALLAGVMIGPHVLQLVDLDQFGIESGTLLEEAARLTLAISLAGVALRLPHGYWRKNARWLAAIIGVGMPVMFVVATGLLWGLLGVPFLVALLVGAVITPTDPVVTTPIVSGSVAEKYVPAGVRFNLSAESGLNDGLAYLLVLLPVALLTMPTSEAWSHVILHVLLWEVLGAMVFGAGLGYGLGKLFITVKRRKLIEESSYLGIIIPLALLTLGLLKLAGTDAVLGVFVAAAVFGQVIPEADEAEEGKIDDTVNRFFIIPVFVLIGIGLPVDDWLSLGLLAPVTVLCALFLRRIAAVWLLRPLFKGLHSKPETAFMSWFGAVGVSALYYATLAERTTGIQEIFTYTTLAITVSVFVHGLTATPLSIWLSRTAGALRRPGGHQQAATD